MAADGVVTITADNWQSEVMESTSPVLVDFWAEWCAPCRAIAPILNQLSEEKAGQLKIAKVNVDEHQQIAGQFGIRSIPTLLLFKNGAVKEQIVGALSKPQLEARLEEHLN